MIHGSSRWYGTPSTVTAARPSIAPAVTGKPIRVVTCGSRPARRWARAISWVLIVYPALVDGSASVTIWRILLCCPRGDDPPAPPGTGGRCPPASPPRGGGGGRGASSAAGGGG